MEPRPTLHRLLAAIIGWVVMTHVVMAAPPVAAADRVLVGAGDIGICDSRGDAATARLLDRIGGTVFTTGDHAYPTGTRRQFRTCYHPDWGRHLARTRPSPGNHDYRTAGAAGYFGYFGHRAGPGTRGYYAYNRGRWRIYSLNSQVLHNGQLTWLRADLAAHPSRCSLAYWHEPRFSSGRHGGNRAMRELWRPLYFAGVDVVVNGHDHNYERFAPQRPDGSRYRKGIREFVVGTGGAELRGFADVEANSVARVAGRRGVLKLTLRDASYAWRFITVGGAVLDSGSARCHGRP